jgi:hypothetical protein
MEAKERVGIKIGRKSSREEIEERLRLKHARRDR